MIWKKQIDYLQNNARLIIPDLPGSGMSEANEELLTIDDYAVIIKSILDKESLSDCIIIGHSMGGYIALAFAEKYARTLSAFGLFHSTAFADSDEKKTARKKSIEFIKKYGPAEFIKQSTPNLFSNNTKENNPEIIEDLIKHYDNFRSGSLVSYYEAMMLRPDRTSVLQNFHKPILFIIGEEDNAVPLEQSLKQSYMPSVSHIHILKDTGHMGMLESTNKSNEFLRSFIQTNSI
jgi:pimeloyl-ACP methyl ester carboxylesterase